MDEYDDLEFECSSQENSDTYSSDDDQVTELEPERDNQKTEQVQFMAALFKKTFKDLQKKKKPESPNEDGTFNYY